MQRRWRRVVSPEWMAMAHHRTFEPTLGHAPYSRLAVPARAPATKFKREYRSDVASHRPRLSRR